ncbi:MAG: hypothetical protein ABS67_02045 [Niabella sp. SCN 42-15]|nr:MAG: hypothetical protein ABS67_02045 [Niabella sp. SCN 42-15]
MISRESIKSIKPVYASYNFYRYLIFQIKLRIASRRDKKDSKNALYGPVPPAKLRHRVHGSLDKESFLEIGKALARDIRNICLTAGYDIYSPGHVLDFGCGSGRVIRNFRDAPSSCHLYGTDIDLELVNWCKENLPNIEWSINGHRPPLHYTDNTFDLIYAISVFIHLDEELQYAWLGELQRVAKQGAIIILTVHGVNCFNRLSSADQKRVHSQGFVFVTGATGKLKLDGLPDFYQNAYHTQEYIQKKWSKYFEIVRYVERGINNHQDAVVLRKQ